MDRAEGIVGWRVGGASRPVLDITVPYADERRNQALLREWRRQAGASFPVPPLRLPRRSEGSYRVRIRAYELLDLPVQDQYSDAVAGSTGGEGGHYGDEVVTHFTLSGEWRFASRGQESRVGAGMLAVRRNEQPWEFEVDRGTRAIAVVLPASAVRFPAGTVVVATDQAAPAARLLLAQLRLFAEVSGELGLAATTAARDATVELFQGLVNDQVNDDASFAPALLEAAKGLIEARLLHDPDIAPRSIAEALNVSPRTLYRVFAQEAAPSVMAYVLERRLERARAELLSTRLTVSELAGRWHFADGSHFAKAYKKRFGETPTASRRS
ncbi:AraC family transcriptional regulator [Nocardioides sp. cx-169]|uniref:helix-turn-helix transcriptional regulator n=1 Tax=Nocardioides sp. cx-169 TaxID=2899080 RepID=UPI001E35D4F1|nr:AraC family transcriptional regulator [Nocardioides sp. cx-169]MCD4536391.1 AraC family transcriptional regulator [Nocardioides sp. cx-169]